MKSAQRDSLWTISDATHVAPDGTLCIVNHGYDADGTVQVWDAEGGYWATAESSMRFEATLIKLKK